MSKNKVDSKKLMSVLNTKDGNFKQLLVKLINTMIKKSYNQFNKKSMKGGNFFDNIYGAVDNIKSYNNGENIKFDNTDAFRLNETPYKFDTVIRTPQNEISSLELHNRNKFFITDMQQDINRSYNTMQPLMSVR